MYTQKEKLQIIFSFVIIISCILVYIGICCIPSKAEIQEFMNKRKEKFNCIAIIGDMLANTKELQYVFVKDKNNSNLIINFMKYIVKKDLQDPSISARESDIVKEVIAFVKTYSINNSSEFEKAIEKHKNDYIVKFVK